MRIAVIGTGISGMAAAYLLADAHDITVFEAADQVGGHTHTVVVDDPSGPLSVDTGFIVYNDWTYPNFCRLLDRLGVETQPSDMSFSVHDERTGQEYRGDNLNTLFAQRSNLLRMGHYRMLWDIFRFYRESRELLRSDTNGLTLGAYVRERRYSTEFIEQHLIPVGAAIWSADPQQFHEFPAGHFVRFCHNHGMLNLFRRPRWRVIRGGSEQYTRPLTAPYRSRIRLRTPVEAIFRHADSVEVRSARYGTEHFDHAIIATHGDQALRMLGDASQAEREILGEMRTQLNRVTLHTDARLMPRRRRAWASWNYRVPRDGRRAATMSYHMNRLQSLASPREYCVSLNSDDQIEERCVLRRLEYRHPIFTPRTIAAQRRHGEISGANRTHFCGAYWGFGFHEDGVNSALAVASHFGRGL